MTGTRDLAILTGGNREMSLEFQRLKYTSENSIRQISGFVLLLMLMLMSLVFSIAYAYVMLMLLKATIE